MMKVDDMMDQVHTTTILMELPMMKVDDVIDQVL